METERQEEFRRLLIPEMTRQELEDRLVEYIGVTDELKEVLMKYQLLDDSVLYCRPPNITYCKKEIYPDFDCNTCKWVRKNLNAEDKRTLREQFIGETGNTTILGKDNESFSVEYVEWLERKLYSSSISNKKLDWDRIIGGMADMLEKEYKNMYGIPSQEFFHFLVCYMESNHPELMDNKKIDWDIMRERYIAQFIGLGEVEENVFEFLEKQPEFN